MPLDSLSTELSIDDLVNQIGTGKFHYKILFLAYFNAFQETSQCAIPGLILPSLKKEFDLSDVELSIYGTFEFLGFFIASFAIGAISDKIGRRNGILYAQIVWLISMVLSIFSPNIYVYSVLRCIISTAFMVIVFCSFSLVSEIWPQKTRGIVLNFIALIVLLGYILTSMFARFLIPDLENSDWRSLIWIYAAILSISIYLNYILLEESPRYDLFIGQKKRAFKTIEKMALQNLGRDDFLTKGKKEQLECWVESFNMEVAKALEIKKQKSDNNFIYEYKKLFKGVYKQITITMFFLWTVNCSNHFAAEFILPTALAKMMEGSDHHPLTVLFYVNLATLPCILPFIAMVELKYFGRKKTLTLIFLAMGCGGCFTFFEVFPSPIFWLAVFKISMQACFMVLYLFTSELYPTHIRMNAIGQSSAISRIGVMIMVWVAVYLSEIEAFLPFLIYGILGILACIVTYTLPYETLNEELDRIISPCLKGFNN